MHEATRLHGHRHRRDHRGDHTRDMRDNLRRHLRRGGHGGQFDLRDVLHHGRSGPYVRRGEIRSLILGALQDRPMHGYEVIQELEALSDGRWRPSAGSVYPTLQQLADEGLVTAEEIDGRRTYTITDAGRSVAAETATRTPWTATEDADEPDIRRPLAELASAVVQVGKIGSPTAKREMARILADARRQAYRLLSEDEPADASDDA